MEKNVRILVACIAGLALLTAIFGFLPVSWLAGVDLSDQGAFSLIINTITLTLGAFMMWCTYFLPTALALQSRHPQYRFIVVVNVLLGWTLIGWFIAFFWVLHGTGEKS